METTAETLTRKQENMIIQRLLKATDRAGATPGMRPTVARALTTIARLFEFLLHCGE